MEERSLAYARYWRNSLADAELGQGALSAKDTAKFLLLKESELPVGQLQCGVVDACFADEPEQTMTVDVVIRTKAYYARVEHGKRRRKGVPEIVAPLITSAVLARDGRLYPSRGTFIARDLLEPLERGSYAIGTVVDLDMFLRSYP